VFFEKVPGDSRILELHEPENVFPDDVRLHVDLVSRPDAAEGGPIEGKRDQGHFEPAGVDSADREAHAVHGHRALENHVPHYREIGTYMDDAFDPTVMMVYAIANQSRQGRDGGPDVTAEVLEKAIIDEIDKVIKEGVTDNELQKVKNQKLMEFYHTMETINGKANTIGTYEVFFGDYKKLFSAPDDYSKVTKEEIQQVAQKYFTKDNRTVGILQTEESREEEGQ